jgi:hypothetical protein
MKTLKFFFSIGTAIFTLLALYQSYNFFLLGNNEQTFITLFFSVVSFVLFTQISKK